MNIKSKPFSDEARWICIYPIYLNAKKTASLGRKVSQKVALDNPTSQEIYDVLVHAGLKAKLEKNKMHPLDPSRDSVGQGRVRVQLKNDDGSLINEKFSNRASILLYACEMVPKLKSRQGGTASSSAQPQPSTKQKKKR
uniref:Signal recognition particle 19 kDa protein n=1 Tax=Acrobeloides nanus TaxID=290746 RepID=A0A914EDH8_9BILA